MGLVQKYKTVLNVGSNIQVDLAAAGTDGILMALDVQWWPLTRDLDLNSSTFGQSLEGPLLFHLEDTLGNEILGTDSANSHRMKVSKANGNYSWVNPHQLSLLWAADMVSKLTQSIGGSHVGKYSGSIKIIADAVNAGRPHHLAIGIQYLEFT